MSDAVAEARKKLEEAGVDLDGWADRDPKLVGAVGGQLDALIKVRDLLTQTMEGDRKRLAVLREQKARLKHGGGGS